MPATRNMSVRNPARAKRLASARATPEPRRRVREALMALGARVRGPREVFLRAIVSRARRKIRYSPENETARFPRWGQTTQLSSRGSRTAASLGTARAARRKRARPRRSRGARWVWERCRSERAKTSMVTTARDCATVKSKQLNTQTAKSCHAFSHAFSHTRALQICHRLLFSPLARALRAGHRTVTTSTSSPSSGASRPSSGLYTPASSPGTVPGAAANAAV